MDRCNRYVSDRRTRVGKINFKPSQASSCPLAGPRGFPAIFVTTTPAPGLESKQNQPRTQGLRSLCRETSDPGKIRFEDRKYRTSGRIAHA